MPYEVKTEIAINATPARVWAVLTDFPRYPEWNPFVLQVEGNVYQNAAIRYRFEMPRGVRIWTPATVLRYEPERELRFSANFMTASIFRGDHYFAIEPAGRPAHLSSWGNRERPGLSGSAARTAEPRAAHVSRAQRRPQTASRGALIRLQPALAARGGRYSNGRTPFFTHRDYARPLRRGGHRLRLRREHRRLTVGTRREDRLLA